MKNLLTQFKMFLLLVIDLAVAFCALIFMLLLRYGEVNFGAYLNLHIIPFSIITVLFILVFYIFNLYSFRFNKNITEFSNSFIKSLLISFSLSVVIFYIFGEFFKLTPKTNLILFTGIFGVIDFYLRILIKRYFVKKNINRKIVIISENEDSLIKELKQNQNIGYEILKISNTFDLDEVISLNPDLVVVNLKQEQEYTKFYALLKKGIFVYTVNDFYEEVFQKVPVEKIEENTVMEYLNKNKIIFNFTKRILDVVLSIILIIILSPILFITTVLIKLTSKGPILFIHKRVSQNDALFTIYKFRSMYIDAEKDGAVWTEDYKKDPRITPMGRFIRATHLDEIPQLVNILKGDISFVGPRPERPEFTGKLEKDIPYYALRHSVKAGLTGWAQVNYKYGSSVEDAREKLKYDFYYIKNRTIFFDILIIMKTIARLFTY